MKAENIIDLKEKYEDGKIVQLVVWQLPEPFLGATIPSSIAYIVVDQENASFVMIMNGEKALISISVIKKYRMILYH